jgi:glycosyltransferase involved in cell wall biosynthesis/GT2 family glycosyltransferase
VTSAEPSGAPHVRALRVSHSSVVASWRSRETWLEKLGATVTLLTARSWREAGSEVHLTPSPDERVRGVRTFGHHPCGFGYDPFSVLRALRSIPYDVLDIHEEPYSVAAFEILALRWLAGHRQPMLFYSAQNLTKRHPLPFRYTERLVLASSKGAYPCNEGAAANLRRKGFEGVVRVIPLGVGTPAPGPEGKLGAHNDTRAGLHIGCAGRLVRAKGFHVVIDCIAREPSWSLTVAGDGPEHENLLEQAEASGAVQRVEFLGYCDETAMADFYRSIDVLVVPSLPAPGWQEQFGRVVVEAMAAGVPVVASRSGALPEVVRDAGVLVPPGDPGALRDALATIQEQPELLHTLADKGLRLARYYTWEAVAGKQIGLYREVLSQPLTDAAEQPVPLPDLAVVIVAYGRPELLGRALGALQRQDGARTYPIVVVDNSSEDDIRRIAVSYGARYLATGTNLGFAAAVNLALANLDKPNSDILLLNPDAEVNQATVAELQRRLHNEARLACVAPAQSSPEGQVQRVAWPFPTPAGAWLEAIGLSRLVKTTGFLIGSVLLLNGAALREVGSFDERFFLYAEESDWQRRARALGWGSRLCPQLSALHVGGASSEHDKAGRELLFAAAVETYFRKWHGVLGWQLSRIAIVFGALMRALLSPRRRPAALRRALCYASGPRRLSLRYALSPVHDHAGLEGRSKQRRRVRNQAVSAPESSRAVSSSLRSSIRK